MSLIDQNWLWKLQTIKPHSNMVNSFLWKHLRYWPQFCSGDILFYKLSLTWVVEKIVNSRFNISATAIKNIAYILKHVFGRMLPAINFFFNKVTKHLLRNYSSSNFSHNFCHRFFEKTWKNLNVVIYS